MLRAGCGPPVGGVRSHARSDHQRPGRRPHLPEGHTELRRALDEIGQLEAELVTAKRYVSGHLQDLAPRAVQGAQR